MKRIGFILCIVATCGGCFDDVVSSDSEEGAPDSIIGYKFVGQVTRNDGKSTTISPGRTLTYQFVNRSTILGEGLVTIETVAWSYRASGKTATIVLDYGMGTETLTLTFESKSSGAFEYRGEMGDLTGWGEGTFTITST